MLLLDLVLESVIRGSNLWAQGVDICIKYALWEWKCDLFPFNGKMHWIMLESNGP